MERYEELELIGLFYLTFRRKWDEYSDMEGGVGGGGGSSSSKHRSRGSETGSPLHNSRHAIPTGGDRGRVPLPYPADHRDARAYPDERWR